MLNHVDITPKARVLLLIVAGFLPPIAHRVIINNIKTPLLSLMEKMCKARITNRRWLDHLYSVITNNI